MGMIFQSPGAAFNPIRTYQKQFIETLKSHGKYHGKTFREEVTAVFGKVGLQDADRILRQCPYALSGGMNQRVALALALLLHQEVLLCDEPTSALDATTALGVVKGLEKLREQGEVTQIIVTHNLAMAGALADRIGVMCEGELVELGEASEIVNSPKHPYTKRLMEAVPRLRRQPGTSYPELPVLETLHLTKDYRVGPSAGGAKGRGHSIKRQGAFHAPGKDGLWSHADDFSRARCIISPEAHHWSFHPGDGSQSPGEGDDS